jgi:hypothetical protein
MLERGVEHSNGCGTRKEACVQTPHTTRYLSRRRNHVKVAIIQLRNHAQHTCYVGKQNHKVVINITTVSTLPHSAAGRTQVHH